MPSYSAVEDSSVLFAFAFQYVIIKWFSTNNVCTGAAAVFDNNILYRTLLDTVSTSAAYNGLPLSFEIVSFNFILFESEK